MTRSGGAPEKRLLQVTAGNVRQNHLYVHGHYDFFPTDCIGAAKRSTDCPTIDIHLAGLGRTVRTDIGRDSKTGKPRGFFRGRGWVRQFFDHHAVKAGTVLSLERLSQRSYRLSVEPQIPRPTLDCAEFFAGIGLVRLALERRGWQIQFANDIDPKKAEMYRHNWPNDDRLVVGDVHLIGAADVPPCTLFTASFPCNDLSIAGRWEGLRGKESSSFWGLVRLLREMGVHRPPLVMLENVLGFLMSHGGRDLEQALVALNELGYLVDAIILNAIHWVPQSRVRLFVIAKQSGGRGAKSCALMSDVRPQCLFDFICAHPNINWDIRDLPPLKRQRTTLADVVEDLHDDDQHWWSDTRVEYFMNQMSPKHAEQARQMVAGDSFTYATAFRRVRHEKSMAELRTDGLAGCLRTPRGGSGRQILLKAGHGTYRVRLLTARECARLQGVPDSYVIDVPLNQALFGFGDAVCVPAVEWIAQNYLTPEITTDRNINECEGQTCP
ncbi:MAG TPA: DNA (cytosine-5-)-methyltransferase [Pirellulales bacterium]|jgi:DNA (cytosine-5)-methyltransferase 1|nr:DNA (cytosine-5-)-methyltransferase [Pirellulales bacterium]